MSIAITSSPDRGVGADGRGIGATVGLGCGEIAVAGAIVDETCGVGVALRDSLSSDAPRLIQIKYPKVAPNKANNTKASAGFQPGRRARLKRRWRCRRNHQIMTRSGAVSR